MTDKEYFDKNLIDLHEGYSDARGIIQPLCDLNMKSASLIISKKNTWRANHYHKTDWHYMYMFEGESDYYYRPAESNEEPKKIVWRKNQLIFTPPMEEHTTVFTQESLFIAISRNPRDQEAYEADVKRVELIDPESVKL